MTNHSSPHPNTPCLPVHIKPRRAASFRTIPCLPDLTQPYRPRRAQPRLPQRTVPSRSVPLPPAPKHACRTAPHQHPTLPSEQRHSEPGLPNVTEPDRSGHDRARPCHTQPSIPLPACRIQPEHTIRASPLQNKPCLPNQTQTRKLPAKPHPSKPHLALPAVRHRART
jgi:hypothetical protein